MMVMVELWQIAMADTMSETMTDTMSDIVSETMSKTMSMLEHWFCVVDSHWNMLLDERWLFNENWTVNCVGIDESKNAQFISQMG